MPTVVEARRAFVRDQLAAASAEADEVLAGRGGTAGAIRRAAVGAPSDPAWPAAIVAGLLRKVSSEEVTVCPHLLGEEPGVPVHVGGSDPTRIECLPCAAADRLEASTHGIAGCDRCGLEHVPHEATLVMPGHGAVRAALWLCDDCAGVV